MVAEPGEDLSEESAASRILIVFFLLPSVGLWAAERDTYLDLFRAARLSEQDFLSCKPPGGGHVSPKFLFLSLRLNPAGGTCFTGGDGFSAILFSLGAPPDDTLMQLAQSQSLHEPEILAAQSNDGP